MASDAAYIRSSRRAVRPACRKGALTIAAALVLLVHGAFSEASVWAGVVSALARAGIEGVAVATPLTGLRRDAAYVASLARAVDGPVVLAGHGYGGAVIAAASCPNATELVYVAAFAPVAGERCVELMDRRALEALCPLIVRYGDGPPVAEAVLRRDRYRELAAGDLAHEDAVAAAATQRPVRLAALEEAAPPAAALPCRFVVATRDRLIAPERQRAMARRAGAEVVELDASHSVPRSRAAEVAEAIAGAG